MTEKRRRPPIPSIVGPFGQSLGRPEEKAEFVCRCFERQFAPNPPMDWYFDEEDENEVKVFLSLPITSVPEPISRDEFSARLAELRPTKASGPDGVSNTTLRRLPEQGILFLVALFKACLRFTYFSQEWRRATVLVIPKPEKDASRVDNLRPISLLSATSKVLERLVQWRIRDHLSNFNVLIPEQFGFRVGIPPLIS